VRSTKLPSWIDRLFGLDPVPAPPHVFALDGGQLRYGSFHPAAKGYVFAASHLRELPADLFSGGVLGGPVREQKVLEGEVQQLVAELPGPIDEASLVLPDTWLRLTFTELTELPRRSRDREAILRWKLKRLVPFRIEDLRIGAAQVTPFPNQEEPLRLLLGFAIELLLSQVEAAFRSAGVEIGRITNQTLATLAGIEHNLGAEELGALLMVQGDAYTLSYFRGGEPLLYRYKAIGELGGSTLVSAVHRDLRLTASFVAQHFPESPLRRAFLVTEPEDEERWLGWLGDELEVPPEPLGFEHFRLARTQVGPSWLETAPLLGAASREVTWS